MNLHKVCHETIPSKFDKMQVHNAQESIHASFKWYEKEVTGLFLSATSVVQYLFFQFDQLIFFIIVFILLIAYQCHLFGLFCQNYECT